MILPSTYIRPSISSPNEPRIKTPSHRYAPSFGKTWNRHRTEARVFSTNRTKKTGWYQLPNPAILWSFEFLHFQDDELMKAVTFLLLQLVGIALAGGAIMAVSEPTNAHGLAHGLFSTMQIGGSGVERHGSVLLFGWLLGLLVVGVIVTGFAIGLQRGERVGPLRNALIAGALVYGALFSALVLAYLKYIQSEDLPGLFGFPLPTAIMLFALWPMPVFFIVLYVYGFDRYIVTVEDLKEFRVILRRRREREDSR